MFNCALGAVLLFLTNSNHILFMDVLMNIGRHEPQNELKLNPNNVNEKSNITET
jgi:hypothetical protein